MNTPVRPATYADIDALAATLARAFDDDPVIEWLVPRHAPARAARVARLFALPLRILHLRHDRTWTTPDLAGAAVWDPPDRWKTTPRDMARGLPGMAAALRHRLPLGLRGLSMVEHRHPPEPHYYLAVLGTDPTRQGKGIGAALLEPVLTQCDREGVGAYLESSKERNVPYYRRFGFEVTDELTLPKGPPVWLMWRDPR